MEFRTKVAAWSLVFLAAMLYWLRTDNVAGLWVDDGGYAVLGKALASGQGYKLLGESNPLDTSFYQPGMPLALAVMWKLFPTGFPDNVPWLKLVNLLSVAVFGLLAFAHFRKRAGDAAAVGMAAATVLCPSLVFLATSSLMSECLFAAVQFGAMVAAERVVASEKNRIPFAMLAGILAGYAYLTRTIGLAAVVVALLWIARKRLWREAVVFAVVAGVMVGGWIYFRHERQKQFTDEQKKEMNYSGFLLERQATTGVPATPKDLSDRILQNIVAMTGADSGALFLPSLYRTASESGEEQIDTTTVLFGMRDSLGMGTGTMGNGAITIAISFLLSLVVLVGFTRALRTEDRLSEWLLILSVVAIVTYSWTPLRFLVPLLPWWFYYFYRGLQHLLPKWREQSVRAAFAVILGLFLFDHLGYLRIQYHQDAYPDWQIRFNSNHYSAEWVKENIPAGEMVGTGNAPLLYLLTDRTVQRCRLEKCRQDGRRYYVIMRQGIELRASDEYVFQTGYSGEGVIKLAPPSR